MMARPPFLADGHLLWMSVIRVTKRYYAVTKCNQKIQWRSWKMVWRRLRHRLCTGTGGGALVAPDRSRTDVRRAPLYRSARGPAGDQRQDPDRAAGRAGARGHSPAPPVATSSGRAAL